MYENIYINVKSLVDHIENPKDLEEILQILNSSLEYTFEKYIHVTNKNKK